jgi:hypothetical protein
MKSREKVRRMKKLGKWREEGEKKSEEKEEEIYLYPGLPRRTGRTSSNGAAMMSH